MSPQVLTSKVGRLFKKFDSNNDDSIDIREFDTVLASMGYQWDLGDVAAYSEKLTPMGLETFH